MLLKTTRGLTHWLLNPLSPVPPMNNTALSFLDDGQSITSVVSALHNYFKNSYSSAKVKRSELLSQLESATGAEEAALLEELQQTAELLTMFGALSDSLSIADRILHSHAVIKAMGMDSELYQPHIETEDEIERDRALSQSRHKPAL